MPMFKPYLGRLPDFGNQKEIAKVYAPRGKACLVFPLFRVNMSDTVEHHYAPEYDLTKAALWCLNAFRLNTNLFDLGVDIFLYIHDVVMRPEIERLLGSAQDYVRFIPTELMKPHEGFCRYLGYFMMPYLDPFFDRYQTVLIWSPDLFPMRNSDVVWDISSFLETGRCVSAMSFDTGKKYHIPIDSEEREYMFSKFDAPTHEGRLAMFKERIYSFVPGFELRCRVVGGLHRFSPAELDLEYKAFIADAMPVLGDDEVIMALWHYKTGYEFESFLEHKVRWSPEREMKDDYYFSHVYGSSPEWEKGFRRGIGV